MTDSWSPEQLKAMEADIACPDCKAPLRLKTGHHGLFYGCQRFPDCNTTHGAHNATWRVGQPYGIPADKETRVLRARAHALAKDVWNWNDSSQKVKFYQWIQNRMGITKHQAHIGMMGKNVLEHLINLLEKKREKVLKKAMLSPNRNKGEK
jgi:ssDNA-binding Zn-finger/Zn-ribbon topoisomerase 1